MLTEATDVIVFKSSRFYVGTLLTECIPSQVYPLSTAFSNRCISLNTRSLFEHISEDKRHKRFEMYAFSTKNVLMWTRP